MLLAAQHAGPIRRFQPEANSISNVEEPLWLIVSPWALGYTMGGPAAWNAFIVGVIIAVAAASALVAFQRWEEWVNVGLGIWLVISPWLLGVSGETNVVWNQIVVGVPVIALAAWSAFAEGQRFAT
jgi:hypothetical protein